MTLRKNDGDYPAKCSRSSTFVIGTANAADKEGEWNGDREVDFIFPGIELSVLSHDDLFDRTLGTTLSRTGSSLATALAAGLAAVILFSVALNNKADLPLVRNHDGMKRAFNAVNNPNKAKSTKFIRVWDLFGLVQEGREKTARDMLQIVVNKLLANLRRLRAS
ncbi:hypothetical protein AYL99_12102 [Fonsecaea erecta]|uniref:Peptidase S8/S53 domain-containing protein n=1 Tax=Fonsecaea erecta TaxID=1367422 RepID=A0A178Z2H5_9EURO|nr:hypothetical protein AYL99_12102 [Fonsecaea erecta]OAP53711.1 hypothetical protein AYL99_12102 [Fonsecaea erecta]